MAYSPARHTHGLGASAERAAAAFSSHSSQSSAAMLPESVERIELSRTRPIGSSRIARRLPSLSARRQQTTVPTKTAIFVDASV